jgi:cytidylate kinase
MEFS